MKWLILLGLIAIPAAALGQGGNCTQKDSSSRPDCPGAIAFFRNFQTALRANDSNAIAGMVAYPLLTTAHHKSVRIRNQQQLLAHFDEVFDSGVRCVVLGATEKDVWGNWQGFTIDGGAVWFDGIIPANEKPDTKAPDYWTKYPFKIKTVNNDSYYPCRSSKIPPK
jgi:hypothetical protein